MVIRDLGEYGRGLPAADMGPALLGALEDLGAADQRPRGRVAIRGYWRPLVDRVAIAAADAAARWRATAAQATVANTATRHGLALELFERPAGPDVDRAWLVDLLGTTAGVSAVHYVTGKRRAPAEWLWPLDVALFDDPASRRLRDGLTASRWSRFITPVSVSRATSPIELLVLDQALPQALARMLGHPRGPRVQAVIVLGGLGHSHDPIGMADVLRGCARADAVLVAHVPDRSRVEFFNALLAELAHDLDLDVAFAAAARDRKLPPPFVVAAEDAFAGAHLAVWASRVGARMALTPELPTPALRMIRSGAPPDVGRALVDHAESFRYGSEGHEASDIAALGHATRSMPPRHDAARARFLQAELFHGEAKVETAPLVPGAHRLDVWIGPLEPGALSAGLPVPEDELPPSPDGHELTVVLASPSLGAPQVKTLLLPPQGASRRLGFDLTVPDSVKRLEARISLLHENRVLQTVVLAASVGSGEPAPLELALEAVVRKDLDGIAGRRPFDAALIANRMSEMRTVSVIASERASLVPAGTSIGTLVEEVTALLQAATNNPNRYGKPDSKGTTELLANLARKGFMLREALLDMPEVRAELEHADRIQIVIAHPDETTLPLEICYDGVAPAADAKMCPQWPAALDTGTCQAGCPGDRSTVVCPVAFWGMHKVIERHAYAKVDAPQLHGNAYALQSEPTTGRTRLAIAGGSLCAAARIAREVDKAAVDQAFAQAGEVAKPTAEVTTWADWKRRVEANPAILVLLAHSGVTGGNRTLVIAESETAFISSVDPSLVGKGGGSGPIVLLLGCSTAIAQLAFQQFVAQFRVAGAAIVIGTLCEILGQHAAPIAGQILAELQHAAAADEPTPLGDLVPVLRRRMLARGFPIVMAVAPYGDADWQI